MALEPRGVEERLRWFLGNRPDIDGDGTPDVGACANHSWKALGGNYGCPPRWGASSANVLYDKVVASGRFFIKTAPPRGALVLWKYGKYGHAALSMGDGKIATTDPLGKPGRTGIEPIDYPKRWGAINYIWTDQYNGIRFPVGGKDMFDYKFLGKPAGTLTVGTTYKALDKSTWDPPRAGLEFTLVYLNIAKVVGAGKLRLRVVRADGDMSGYIDIDVSGPRLFTYTYFELGNGKPTHVELKCHGGLKSVTLDTRYTKKAVVAD